MNGSDEDRLFKKEWRRMHDPEPYLRAVILAYEATDAAGGMPGAEVWSTNRPYFTNHAIPRVVAFWSEETKFSPEQFPWGVDSVVYTWISWRKAMAPVIDSTKQKLGLVPKERPAELFP